MKPIFNALFILVLTVTSCIDDGSTMEPIAAERSALNDAAFVGVIGSAHNGVGFGAIKQRKVDIVDLEGGHFVILWIKPDLCLYKRTFNPATMTLGPEV